MTQVLPEEVMAFRVGRPEVGDLPFEARMRARAQLLAAAQVAGAAGAGAGAAGAPRRGRAGGRRRPGLVAGAVAAGAVAAGAAVAITLALLPGASGGGGAGLPHGGQAGAPVSVAAILQTAAATAARQPAGVVPGPGQYLYLRDIEMKGGGTSLAHCGTLTGQEWMAADRSGHQSGRFPAGCGHDFTQKWAAGGISRGSLGWPVDLLAWQGLPTSPAALERAIVRRYESSLPTVTISGGSLRTTGLPATVIRGVERSVTAKTPGHRFTRGAQQAMYQRLRAIVSERTRLASSATFTYAAQLLQFDAPPALRSALFRVMERLPGVKALGPATDRLGRPGIAIGFTASGVLDELIFDRATSRALEVAGVAVGPRQNGNNDEPAGTVLDYVVYVSIGVVNSATATPLAAR